MTENQQASSTATVQDSLDQLWTAREAEWTPERLKAHQELRDGLEHRAVRERFIKAGDRVVPFSLPEVDGGTVELTELLNSGPVVLIFFRFESCPACNVALPAYRDALAPALLELGAHLVAISPQVPEKLVEFKRRHELAFPVASDVGAVLIDSFGIAFGPEDEAERERQVELLGGGNWKLPYPTVVVIDRDGVVAFADVHPNWMVRTEASTVIEAVRALG